MATNMSEQKFCKNCMHCRDQTVGVPRCFSPNLGVDLVNGTQKSEMCVVVRIRDSQCCTDAKWFEPKPVKVSLVQRIKNIFN